LSFSTVAIKDKTLPSPKFPEHIPFPLEAMSQQLVQEFSDQDILDLPMEEIQKSFPACQKIYKDSKELL
jgi:hypothetical protein